MAIWGRTILMILGGLSRARAAYLARLRMSAIWVGAHLPPRAPQPTGVAGPERLLASPWPPLTCLRVSTICTASLFKWEQLRRSG
jgi:hypothetical protein